MENESKGLSVVIFIFLLIIIFGIFGIGGYILYNNRLKINQLEEKLANQNEVKNDNAPKFGNIIENEIDEDEAFVVPSFQTGKLMNSETGMEYSFTSQNGNFFAEIENGIPIVSTNLGPEVCAEYANSGNVENSITAEETKLNNSLSVKITDVSKNVVDIHIGCIGQSEVGTVFVFIMEDGTIEYSGVANLIRNGTVEGKIDGLKNIVKIQDVDVMERIDEAGGPGYVSMVAIDIDNNVYSLDSYIN